MEPEGAVWESGWARAMPGRWAETDGPEMPLGLEPAEPGDGPQMEEGERERELPRLRGQESQL